MARLSIDDVLGPWRCGRVNKDDPDSAAKHANIQLSQISLGATKAFFYYSPLVIDVDGAPNAYGPRGTNHLDSIENAGDVAKGYYGVVAFSPAQLEAENRKYGFTGETPAKEKLRIDLNARCLLGRYPVFQRSDQPRSDLYVSKCPYHVKGTENLPDWNQNKYADATTVPYGALAGKLQKHGLALMDKCLSIRVDRKLSVEYLFGDAAGAESNNLAEVSLATALGLGARNKDDNEFLSCHFAFGNSKELSIFETLHSLSLAENAADLPYFIACQIEAGPSVNAIARLRRFQHLTTEQKLRLKPALDYPRQYSAVVAALSGVGFLPAGSFSDTMSGFA